MRRRAESPLLNAPTFIISMPWPELFQGVIEWKNKVSLDSVLGTFISITSFDSQDQFKLFVINYKIQAKFQRPWDFRVLTVGWSGPGSSPWRRRKGTRALGQSDSASLTVGRDQAIFRSASWSKSCAWLQGPPPGSPLMPHKASQTGLQGDYPMEGPKVQ